MGLKRTHSHLRHPRLAPYLVEPASGQSVTVSVKTADQKLVLSAGNPGPELWSAVLMDEEIWLKRDDSTDEAVQFQGYVLALPPPSDLVNDEEEAVLGEGEAAAAASEDDADAPSCSCERCQAEALLSDEEEIEFQEEIHEEFSYSDGCEEESDGEVDVPLKIEGEVASASGGGGGGPPPLIRRHFVPEGRFLGPAPRFASAGSTAGFMRIAAVKADPATGSQQVGKQILVLYRYTGFSMASSGRKGVEVCSSTKLHQLRFVVPPAGDTASSLPWAGSSLAPLIYPARSSKELQALWSSLVSAVSIPPRATRIQVIVDVGILRRGDCTRKRMEDMRAALEGMMAEPWPGYHVGVELRLPEPVRYAEEGDDDDDDDTGGERPAKRRTVVAELDGQECPVCFELLESGIAAWPGCSMPHVFHDGCLALILKESEMCPICRCKLSAPLDDR